MKDLLFHLIQYPFDPLKKDRLKVLLNQVQDWNKTVELINAHGIIALAAYNIKEAGLENEVPADAMTALENGYRQSVVRNIWLTERWKEINEILQEAGIKHILLKGMALEHTLYGSKGLRQMTDCDIFVKREDSLKAWYLLQNNGFSHKPLKSPLHKKMLIHTGKHLPSLTKDGYIVEIHHNLFESENTSGEDHIDPFDTAVQINIADTKAFTLSKKIQSEYLTSHFKRHLTEGSCQLRLYADIMLLENSAEIRFPESFLHDPGQENKTVFRKAAYKAAIKSVPGRYKFQYILGDIFPSLRWMKKRYGCGVVRAVLYYPQRLGKLLWLV